MINMLLKIYLRIPLGTRSLLFGVHHWLFHPMTVFIAWVRLYGLPSWREAVCIVIHDWGYWGSPNMDGIEGELHCQRSAQLAARLGLGPQIATLVEYHSRHYARTHGQAPSRLCWADKLSHAYYPVWLYLLLARASGEIWEYRQNSHRSGFAPYSMPDAEWFVLIRSKMAEVGLRQDAERMSYTH